MPSRSRPAGITFAGRWTRRWHWLSTGTASAPFCGAAHRVVEAIQDELGGAPVFAERHFPARPSIATRGPRGQFWPMQDMLFEDQQHLCGSDLVARARILGLDVDRFKEDVATEAHAGKVQEDFLSGVQSGVPGAPTFFINGAPPGGADFRSLMTAVGRVLDEVA